MKSPGRTLASWVVLLTAAAGCSESHEKFIPKSAAARKALEVTLDFWKSGNAEPEVITLVEPPLHPIDRVWKSGAKLSAYEIVEELESKADEPKKFAVLLTLEGQPPLRTVYYVVGLNPVFVMPEEDFEQTKNM